MISVVVTNGVDIGTVAAIELFASYAVAIVVATNIVSSNVVVSIVFVASAVVARVSCISIKLRCNNDKKIINAFFVFSGPFQANSGGTGVDSKLLPPIVSSGNTNQSGRLNTVHLLFKVACIAKK